MSTTEQMKEHFESFIAENEKFTEKGVKASATRARKALHLLRSDYKYNYPLGADYLVYIQEKK